MEPLHPTAYQTLDSKMVGEWNINLHGDLSLPMLSSTNLARLFRFEECLTTVILPAVNNPRGYGHGASPKTLETWDVVKIKLDYLCDSWGHALQNLKQESTSTPSREEIAPFANLEVALAIERVQIAGYDADFDQKTHEERLESLEDHNRSLTIIRQPPELSAYKALCALQQYSKEKGWTTDAGFGRLLGESELKERDEIFEKCKDDIFDKVTAKDTSTRLWHH